MSTQRGSARSTAVRTGRSTTRPAGPDFFSAAAHLRSVLTPTPISAAFTA
ncbi:hypothetical protein [Streptomyces luteolus]|uniref:Uncharacterized protein n=1 Tax=Streptomyces luteolus TaxID=3043615 RepID=A0ABT6ST66_9ACTN|nr:hypothetical protein [Streptomyces sp. B-S-A12]MDI3418802.1 hypothetical protein [Streptomyces sp. B-S-A12]